MPSSLSLSPVCAPRARRGVRVALALSAIVMLASACASQPTTPATADTAEAAPPAGAMQADAPVLNTPPKIEHNPDNSARWCASRVALTGVARDAKMGAVLLVGPGEIPVYLEGRDAWDAQTLGATIHVTGDLVREAHLPVSDPNDKVPVQGTAPGSTQWVLKGHRVAPQPNAMRVTPLGLMRAGWPKRARCLERIEAMLREEGEAPEAFCVRLDVTVDGRRTRFRVAHEENLKSSNRFVNGNPGGKGRDAMCDVVGEDMKVYFRIWQ